jgi:hypothetical protein
MQKVVDEVSAEGRKVYIIPGGGSTPNGMAIVSGLIPYPCNHDFLLCVSEPLPWNKSPLRSSDG